MATTATLVACGGGSSSTPNPAAGPESQAGGTAALVAALANGNNVQDSTSHWICETTNSALTADGVNQTEFRFFNDFSGRQGDTSIGADQGITWLADNADTVQVTFTDTDPATSSILNSISLNTDNTQFSTSIEEIVGINLLQADYNCSLINSSDGEPVTPPNGDNDPNEGTTLAQRLISTGTAETGFSWTCTYSNSSDTHTYGFNADNTGSDFSSADSTTTGIDIVITEPSSIRATFFNSSFASLFWNQISFQDADNFTANDGLAFGDPVIVACTKGAPSAPPAPEPPAPISAACPCQINLVSEFMISNATSNTFVISSSFAGGRAADIDLDGDSLIDMGVIVRDTGILDCSFSPFSAEFGVEDPGQPSLTTTQATTCMNDLDDLLNQGL